MCDPGTIAIAATVASTALTAYSQVQAGNAANEAAKYNAAVQRNNAILADRKARQEREKGVTDVVRRQRETAQRVGDMEARIGASGVELASGSPLDVLVATEEQGALDAEIIRANAEQRARDLQFEAENLRSQSVLTRQQGRAAQTQGFLAAGGTVLTGASRTAGLFDKYGNPFKKK